MPVYEYRCKSCGKTHEIEHGFNDRRPTECPSCGGELVRVFHPIGVVFKGSGFHKTDYGGSSARAANSSGSPSESGSASGDGGGKEAASGKDTGGAKDSAASTTAKPAESPSKPSTGTNGT